ncbi:hypothetical protein BGW39_006339 [Mortierella sp. 14UC]|nr:hypothetical protein BGW39_006339 [Mortierella sp. 14UC]
MDNYSHMDIPVALTTVYHMASQTTAQHALNTNNTHLNAAANGGAATGRNPAYGLEDEAMDGYRNNDNPAFRPASRAPQLYESDQPAAEIQRSDNTKLLRAPQKYMESVIATTLTEHYIQTMIDARLGEVGAQVALGDMYRDGKGVQQDYQTAMDWYLLAEEQGNLNACSRLGDLYRDGLGVEVDKVVAKSWYQKAADQGLESAQYNLNCLTLNFKGVHTNIYDELKWLQKAANDGVLGAERKLRLAMDRIDDFALERV